MACPRSRENRMHAGIISAWGRSIHRRQITRWSRAATGEWLACAHLIRPPSLDRPDATLARGVREARSRSTNVTAIQLDRVLQSTVCTHAPYPCTWSLLKRYTVVI
jgi:hypothetical protein